MTALDLSLLKDMAKVPCVRVSYLTTCHMAGSHVGKKHVTLSMEGHVFHPRGYLSKLFSKLFYNIN